MMITIFKPLKAFSLAELAITLGIIAILAVTLLPMISNSQAGPRKYTATLKTTMTTIENAIATELQRSDRFDSYTLIQQTMKPEKSCPSRVDSEGCWDGFKQGWPSVEVAEPGFILKNGVAIGGLNTWGNSTYGLNGWILDANGADGPNLANVDQLTVRMCAGEATTCSDPSGGGHKVAKGVFVPDSAGANATRFDEIME